MSKFLGLDYGSKRVGLALSDESGALAFPKSILNNNATLIDKIKKICQTENVVAIVLGESLDQAGRPNPIMKKIESFKKKLEENIKLPVYLESEIFTSAEARRIPDKVKPSRRFNLVREAVDAGAAALILQRFLEKNKWK